jgi:hypothetical protein
MSEVIWAEAMQGIRERLSPPENDPGAKRSTCRGCGDAFWQWFGQYHDVCPACSAGRQVESVRSMRNKAGYMYERWVVKRYLSAKAELERLGLSTAGPLGDPDNRET